MHSIQQPTTLVAAPHSLCLLTQFHAVARGQQESTPYIAAATHLCTQSQTMHEQLAPSYFAHPRNRPAPAAAHDIFPARRHESSLWQQPPAFCRQLRRPLSRNLRRTSARLHYVGAFSLESLLPSFRRISHPPPWDRALCSALFSSLLPALSRPLSGRACARSPHDLRSRRRRGTPR